MCRLAGEIADGFVLHPLNSAKYLTEMVLPELEAGARKAGRPLSTIPILNMPFVVTGRDDREVAYWTDVVKRQIAYYASTRTYTRIMELHGWADIPARLHEMTSAGRWDDLPTIISDEMLETFAVVGAPSEIPRMLFERYDGLVSRLSLYHGEVPVERTALLAAFAGA
jgi:alkanesulfonate monooxygenase SsuD/methylene tetrahydromethanopterin reductase-like flavin-dependent oxidoreductase (luciferase family)